MNKEKYLATEPFPKAGGLNRPLSETVRRLILVIFSFLFFNPVFSQKGNADSGYTLLFEIRTDAKDFTTDKLQNIYLLTANNDVVKLTPTGEEQFRYPNTTLGEPNYIDATNPFNLLLYFPDFQNVVTLDRTLNLTGEINLQELGFFRVNALGMAGDGNLWVYDEVDFRLKKIGRDGHVILQSADLSLELRRGLRPNFLLERGQKVYLNDPEVGVLVFDVFGKYMKTLPLMGLADFQVVGEELVFLENGQLYSFHLKTLLRSPLRLPAAPAAGPEGVFGEKKIRIEKDVLYILEREVLKVYRF